MKYAPLIALGIVVSCVSIVLSVSTASGAELYIPEHGASSGNRLTVPVCIDRVDNLAGMKLVLRYDHEVLRYRQTVRGEKAASLMHIVNDKQPGTLIVVMAGARGIAGKDLALFSLTFDIEKGLKQKQTTRIAITGCQLMSDQLKEIACTCRPAAIPILPESTPQLK